MSTKLLLFIFFFVVVSMHVEAGYVMQCNRVCRGSMYEMNGCCRAYGWRAMAGGRCSCGWMAFCTN